MQRASSLFYTEFNVFDFRGTFVHGFLFYLFGTLILKQQKNGTILRANRR